MKVQELRPGLWRWTGLHPAWQVGAGWEHEVGSVYYEAPGHVVLIDPLVPPEDDERFLAALDRDVERLGRPVAVVLTTARHRRSTDFLVERYEAVVAAVPGVELLPVAPSESAAWIPEHCALVLGDALGGSPLRWRGDGEAGRALLELPLEILAPSHGDPVTGGARLAVQIALDA